MHAAGERHHVYVDTHVNSAKSGRRDVGHLDVQRNVTGSPSPSSGGSVWGPLCGGRACIPERERALEAERAGGTQIGACTESELGTRQRLGPGECSSIRSPGTQPGTQAPFSRSQTSHLL